MSDGGGEYFAARVPLVGPTRVAKFHLKISSYRSAARFELHMMNGLPALVVEFHDNHRGQPPRMVLRCDVDPQGRIAAIHAVLASRKLTAVQFPLAG